MGDKKPCPVCGGTGSTGIPVTSIYLAKVNDYFTLRKDDTKRHRIRLEILAAFHEEFLDIFEHGDDVAVFVIPLDDWKNSAQPLEEYMEETND